MQSYFWTAEKKGKQESYHVHTYTFLSLFVYHSITVETGKDDLFLPFEAIANVAHDSGNIFCHDCSSRKVPLPQLGYGTKPVRVCNGCFDVAYLVTYAIDEDHGLSTQVRVDMEQFQFYITHTTAVFH